MITKRRKWKFNTTFFSKNEHHIVCIVNQTVPKIITISVHTVNRFPLSKSIFVKGSAVMRLDEIKYHEVLMSFRE
jgi:hypothetical protein